MRHPMNLHEMMFIGIVALAFVTTQTVQAQSAKSGYEKLMAEAAELATRCAKLDETSAEGKSLRASLHETLVRAFEARQRVQREEIAAARAELDAVEMRVDQRDDFRQQIIRRKAEDLLAGRELHWPEYARDPTFPGASEYQIKAGDVVAVYLEGVLPFNAPNQPPIPPPITKLDSGAIVTGYPIVVTSDGTIKLPLLAPIKIEGHSIRDAEKKVAKAYIDNDILRPEKASPMMTLVPSSRSVDSILSLPTLEATPAKSK